MKRSDPRPRTPGALAPLGVVNAVMQWAEMLEGVTEPVEIARALLPVLGDSTGATRASILLVNPFTGRLRILAGLGLPRKSTLEDLPPAPRRISDWVLRECRSVLMNGALRDERFEASAPHDRIASAMSLPLPGSRGVIGVLNLARVGTTIPFTADDLASVEATTAAIAALFERIQDLGLARHHWRTGGERPSVRLDPEGRAAMLALSLVPGTMPSPDVCVHLTRQDGTTMILLAEPFGPAIPALRTAEWLSGAYHSCADRARSLSELAAELDAGLRRSRPGEGVRAWLGSLSTNGSLRSCAAGYPAPFCLPSEGAPGQPLREGGPPLGTASGPGDYEDTVLRMLPGDGLLVVSDGVLLARSLAGREFGEEGVLGHLLDHSLGSLEALVNGLTRAAHEHLGLAVPTDDLLAFALRHTRSR